MQRICMQKWRALRQPEENSEPKYLPSLNSTPCCTVKISLNFLAFLNLPPKNHMRVSSRSLLFDPCAERPGPERNMALSLRLALPLKP